MLFQHTIFPYILWATILFFAPILAEPLSKSKFVPIHGRWSLAPDGQLFKQTIQLQFHSASSGHLRAQRIAATPGQSKRRNYNEKASDMIWGLQFKNGEYLYGWIALPAGPRYRCKLWQRQKRLYLRIYNPPLYTTHQLRPQARLKGGTNGGIPQAD